MSLKEELKSLRTRLEAGRPPEVVGVMHRAIEELRASGASGRLLRVGQKAPEWVLPNAAGEPVDSKRLLAQGPLVVTFYRGRW